MNDRMLVQRKLAATPTFTPPKSTPLTPDSTQKPAAAVPQAVTEVQPSLTEVQSSTGKQETPDLQTQLERAAHFGHHFGRISVLQPQAKLTVSQPGDSEQQQASRVASRVMSLPAPQQLLRPTLLEVDRSILQAKQFTNYAVPVSENQEEEQQLQQEFAQENSARKNSKQRLEPSQNIASSPKSEPPADSTTGTIVKSNKDLTPPTKNVAEQEGGVGAANDIVPKTEATLEAKGAVAKLAAAETKADKESNKKVVQQVAVSKNPARVEPPAGQVATQPPAATPANQTSLDSPAASELNFQPTPRTNAPVTQAATAGGSVAVSAGGASETGAEGMTEGPSEQEIEATVAGTEGIELPTSDRADIQGFLAEVGNGGNSAPSASGGSGGGGGGGAAIEEQPAPSVPDVSQAEPSGALAAISQLPPAQIQIGLGGVAAAASNSIGKQQAELAANPPQIESPSGSPATKKGSAGDRPLPAGKTLKPFEKARQGQAKSVRQPKQVNLPPAKVQAVSRPTVTGDPEGKVSAGDVQALKASIAHMPTRDPSLNVTAGSPPSLQLEGDANPQQANEQRARLEKSLAVAQIQGQQESAQPMGEDAIYPNVPQETLKAEGISGGKAGSGAAGEAAVAKGAVKGIAGSDAASIIAQQQQGQEIQAAVARSQAQIATQRQQHAAKVAQEKASSNQEITKLQQENTTQQAKERENAQAQVGKLRADWNKEQTALIEKSRRDADAATAKGTQDIQQQQIQAEAKAVEQIEKGNQEAEAARLQGEERAEAERRKGEQESGGIFGWLADKAKAFFEGIKRAIQAALEAARAAVKAAIEVAQKLATAVIEAARKVIVTIIKAVGEALIAIGNVLLAAFPGLRDRFCNAIKGVVKAAEAAVNALANTLKKGVQAALNLLGKALNAALGLLEKGMLAAVDVVKTAVGQAIKLADAAIKAMGAFAVLVKDIASNPGQWLRNLGAGAMDGIKNHFWGAFQTAVKQWFSQKVEEVLGLGMTIWNVLKQGGINLPEVAKMAWEGIKSAIPAVLIQLLIEKVVSMIVPAAGTVMLIIEGLQAAWGTLSRILQAFERFMAFLKAVKTGQAGPPFGSALAVAGVVVIDFVSNWLLRSLRGPASKVAAKIREIAKKIGNKLKKVAKKLGQKFGSLKDKFFGKKGTKGDKEGKHRHEGDRAHGDHKEDKERKNQEKLDKAVAAIKPQAEQLLRSGTTQLYLKAKLLFWKVRYGLSSLTLDSSGTIRAKVNPEADITKVKDADLGKDLLDIFAKAERDYEQKLLSDLKIKQNIDEARQKWAAREPHSLAGLSRYEQAMVIRDTPVPALDLDNPLEAAKKGAKEVEPGVKVWLPSRGGKRGMVQIPGRVHRYGALLENLKKKAGFYDFSEQEMASIIFGKPDAQQEKLNSLRSRLRHKIQSDAQARSKPMTEKGMKKAFKSIDTFVNQLAHTALLSQTYEPSRIPGIPTATIVSSTMAMGGEASLEEILSPEGRMAPMTLPGAAPEDGKAKTKEQLEAEEKRYERVGHIFKHLLETARKQKILVTESGYDLSKLAAAIERWLSQKLSKEPTELAASEALLHTELIQLISSSHKQV